LGREVRRDASLWSLDISALNAVSRRDNTDHSHARSAWEGVPRKNRPVGYGMIGCSESQRYFSSTCAPCFCLSFHIRNFVTAIIESVRTPCTNQTVPYGTALLGGVVPGTSCRATIAPSLRDAFSPLPLGHNPGAIALDPVRKKGESRGSADFTGLYAGEAAALSRELPAGELTSKLAAETVQRLRLAVFCFWHLAQQMRPIAHAKHRSSRRLSPSSRRRNPASS
jgi:hypothetical protein